MSKHKPIALDFEKKSAEVMLASSRAFCDEICKRRTVREFSSQPVDEEVVLNAIRAAGSSPSGANKQPSPMAFLNQILKRPENEKPYLVQTSNKSNPHHK